jgi:hypothetical protein
MDVLCQVKKSNKLLNIPHQLHGYITCLCLKIAFGIDPYDRLCIGSPEMNPVRIKFDLQSIFRVDGVLFVFLFDFLKNGFYVHTIFEFDLILGNEIVRVISS